MFRKMMGIAVLLSAVALFAADVVNSRVVPTKEDFSSFGDATNFYLYDTLWTEILPILSSGRNTDAIDVDSARVTTGNISQVVADSVTFGGLSISAIDSSGTDSIAITIDGVKYWIAVTSTE